MGVKLATVVAVGWLLVGVSQAAHAQAQAEAALPARPPTPPEIKTCRPSAPIGQVGGDVELAFRVTADGRVDSSTVRVVRAEGITEAAALSAALRFVPGCRFTPAKGPSGAVAVSVTQPIHFPESGIPLAVLESDTLLAAGEAPVVLGCQVSTLLSPRSVVVSFILGTNGKAEAGTVRIVQMTARTALKAAEGLVASCRYAPARLNGVPTRVLVQQPFVLE